MQFVSEFFHLWLIPRLVLLSIKSYFLAFAWKRRYFCLIQSLIWNSIAESKNKYRRPRHSLFQYLRFWLLADLKTTNNEGKLVFLVYLRLKITVLRLEVNIFLETLPTLDSEETFIEQNQLTKRLNVVVKTKPYSYDLVQVSLRGLTPCSWSHPASTECTSIEERFLKTDGCYSQVVTIQKWSFCVEF